MGSVGGGISFIPLGILLTRSFILRSGAHRAHLDCRLGTEQSRPGVLKRSAKQREILVRDDFPVARMSPAATCSHATSSDELEFQTARSRLTMGTYSFKTLFGTCCSLLFHRLIASRPDIRFTRKKTVRNSLLKMRKLFLIGKFNLGCHHNAFLTV